MSHRKYEAPRHGSLGFLPRCPSNRKRGRIRAFPHDRPTRNVNEELWQSEKGVHLTGFMGYKAGMTHILRDFERHGIKVITLETCEPVTVIECPPMTVVGIVGYLESTHGMRAYRTIWTRRISHYARRRLTSNWYRSKKNFFRHHCYAYNSVRNRTLREEKERLILERCKILRVIAHSNPQKLTGLGIKRAHIVEIQVNGGRNMADKLAFAKRILGKNITVDQVFEKDDLVDCIGISQGRGTKGVIGRWHVRCLPRKTHKGLRKVACIGAWHPANVTTTVARAGKKGYYHRTIINKKIYRLDTGENPESGSTPTDLTKKTINPVSGFRRYGFVRHHFIVVKGSVVGCPKQVITLRKSLKPDKCKRRTENIAVKFYDTSSKTGRGRFQTRKEKLNFYGPTKRQLARQRQERLRRLEEGADDQ